ncbi:MAG: FluC/FEX family fluoride channel, partial [Cellulomonadaceae bacterium]
GAGTALRFALERAFAPGAGEVPWVTFAINVVGSFALGLVLTGLARSGSDDGWRRAVRVGVGTGLIGGFTTYSTFILEVDRLVPVAPVLAGGYALASVVAGIGAAALGVGAASRTEPGATA